MYIRSVVLFATSQHTVTAALAALSVLLYPFSLEGYNVAQCTSASALNQFTCDLFDHRTNTKHTDEKPILVCVAVCYSVCYSV